MAFVIELRFASPQEKETFIERSLPKVRGKQVDIPGDSDMVRTPEEDAGLVPDNLAERRFAVAVTSQSAAKELCHILLAYLAHNKVARLDVAWKGSDGTLQHGEVRSEAAREAEILAMRLGAAAKAHMDSEKAASV